MAVECGINNCKHCEKFNESYGYCRCPDNIVLKFRIAADFGKGTMVMVECLNMELPG